MIYQGREIQIGDSISLDADNFGIQGKVVYIGRAPNGHMFPLLETEHSMAWAGMAWSGSQKENTEKFKLNHNKRYWWIESSTWIVDLVPAVKIKELILSCKECHTFAHYAVANQADGTFVCYSCRHTNWKYMRPELTES